MSSPSDSTSLSSNTDTSTDVKKNGNMRYVRTGIGGAGNYHKVDLSVWATSAGRASLLERCKRPFRVGIGGAGNRCMPDETPALPANEQAARVQAQREHLPTQIHVGIGGMGNCTSTKRDSFQTSQSESPLLSPGAKPAEVHYSTEPLRVGAADRLAAKLFGYRR
ncbi:MAG: hypothetical protein M1823_002830 [Watsoniomyces obsoletus]|nr:MAG: hypothetical protein M1823_002830 [Watsoniomyces obsoletus]